MSDTIKITQDVLRDFVDKNVLENETMFVEEGLKDNKFSRENVENNFLKEGWCESCSGETEINTNGDCPLCQNPIDAYSQDIFEWWSVNDWLIEKLASKGEPILRTENKDYWGRTCTGQAIFLDSVIEEIYKEIRIH